MPLPAELHFFLARAPTVAGDEFRQAILALSKTLDARAAFRIVMPQTASAHAEATAHADAPADALLSLQVPVAADLAAAEVALRQARPMLNLQQSTVLETARHDVVPGCGKVMIFFALHRLPRLSREGFQSYWLSNHAEHGRRTLIPPNTYSQLHAVEPGAFAVALARAAGIGLDTHDGIAEVYFPDIAAFEAQMARAEVAVEALEDEKNFIAHERSTFGLYDVAGEGT